MSQGEVIAGTRNGALAPTSDGKRDTVGAVYQSKSRRVLATLIRLLGDFDLAEEALHHALPQRWSNGLGMTFPPILAPGSFRPAVLRPLTPCADTPGSMPRWRLSPSN